MMGQCEVAYGSATTGSATVAVRFESLAETEERRQALLAEAKIWRFIARRALRMKVGGPAADANFAISEAVRRRFGIPAYERSLARIESHLKENGYEWATSGGVTAEALNEVALFDLLLALECEDEAKALLPAKRDRKERAK